MISDALVQRVNQGVMLLRGVVGYSLPGGGGPSGNFLFMALATRRPLRERALPKEVEIQVQRPLLGSHLTIARQTWSLSFLNTLAPLLLLNCTLYFLRSMLRWTRFIAGSSARVVIVVQSVPYQYVDCKDRYFRLKLE